MTFKEWIPLLAVSIASLFAVAGWAVVNRNSQSRDLVNWKRTMLATEVTAVLELTTHIAEKLAVIDDLSRLEKTTIESEGRAIVRRCNMIQRLGNQESNELAATVSTFAVDLSTELWKYQKSLGKGGDIEVSSVMEKTLGLDSFANKLTDSVFMSIDRS